MSALADILRRVIKGRIKGLIRECCAEFFGTLILVVLGCGVNC